MKDLFGLMHDTCGVLKGREEYQTMSQYLIKFVVVWVTWIGVVVDLTLSIYGTKVGRSRLGPDNNITCYAAHSQNQDKGPLDLEREIGIWLITWGSIGMLLFALFVLFDTYPYDEHGNRKPARGIDVVKYFVRGGRLGLCFYGVLLYINHYARLEKCDPYLYRIFSAAIFYSMIYMGGILMLSLLFGFVTAFLGGAQAFAMMRQPVRSGSNNRILNSGLTSASVTGPAPRSNARDDLNLEDDPECDLGTT